MKKLSKLPRLISLIIALTAFGCFQRAAAQAPQEFTVSGTVTDSTGAAMADVMVILISDVTGTQITFADQSGNYVLTYAGGVSHSLNIMPSKSGYTFSPQLTIFISSGSITGNKTVSFAGTPIPIVLSIVQTPIMLTQEGSLRSLALDSVTWAGEPFGVVNDNNFSTDHRTRVSLFVVNMELRQGDPLSVIEAQAEDSLGQVFPLTVEYFGTVPGFSWLKQVVVQLPDAIANSNEVRVGLKVHSVAGNKVLVKVKL